MHGPVRGAVRGIAQSAIESRLRLTEGPEGMASFQQCGRAGKVRIGLACDARGGDARTVLAGAIARSSPRWQGTRVLEQLRQESTSQGRIGWTALIAMSLAQLHAKAKRFADARREVELCTTFLQERGFPDTPPALLDLERRLPVR